MVFFWVVGFPTLVMWAAAGLRALVNPASCPGDCGGVFIASATAWAGLVLIALWLSRGLRKRRGGGSIRRRSAPP
jgi:hypothetical protein